VTEAEVTKQVRSFESTLKSQATADRAISEKKYLKSNLRFIGANAAAVRGQVIAFVKASKQIDKQSLDQLCDALWQTECHELRSIAIGLMERLRDKLVPRDLPRLRTMIIESAGWAHVDTIAVHIVGSIYESNSKIESSLRVWSTHKDFWVRRASMLALLNPARHCNRKAFDLFAEFAASMLPEREFFIRKAIGWVLREVSKERPDWVVEFFETHAGQASGLTLREGTKYLQGEDRLRLRTNNLIK